MNDYASFLAGKQWAAGAVGFEPKRENRKLFEFQTDAVNWACRRGRAALFEDCGLGKTAQQLEWADEVATETGKPVLILTPLAVAPQTVREAAKFDIIARVVADDADVKPGCNITNYEKLHHFDVSRFGGIVLDESSILKAYDGKTRTTIIESFNRTPYRLACTATPAPNDHMELGNHAEFLGVMSRTEMLSMFFVHDGGDTAKWRLKGHAEDAFWRWVCSWAIAMRRPSDLGYSNGAFMLPPLNVVEHVIDCDGDVEPGMLFAMPASSLAERRGARRASLDDRVKAVADLANSTNRPWLVWCNLNDESAALTAAINGAVEVKGGDSDEHKERAMLGFADGSIRALVTKPSICGFGMNWQHCADMAFCGITDSYEQFYQSVRRCWRFGQKQEVNAHVVISQQEQVVLANIKRKEADAQRMAEKMVEHMRAISGKDVSGARRDFTDYQPKRKIQLPSWIQ